MADGGAARKGGRLHLSTLASQAGAADKGDLAVRRVFSARPELLQPIRVWRRLLMSQPAKSPLKIRFLNRSLPPVETREGRFIVEPAIYGNDLGVRHCIVAHSERAGQDGRFDVVELSPDFGSYLKLLLGFSYGFEVQPEREADRERASLILRRLLDLEVVEVVN
jgi:hypothetical protein